MDLLFPIKDRFLVVMLDDFHWLDFASWMLMWRLWSDPKSHILLLGTHRPFSFQELPELWRPVFREESKQFPLELLSKEGSAELLRSVLGTKIDNSSAGQIYNNCGGHPLFLVELTKTLTSRTAVEAAGLSSLSDLVIMRMDALSLEDRRRLRICAALCSACEHFTEEDLTQVDDHASPSVQSWFASLTLLCDKNLLAKTDGGNFFFPLGDNARNCILDAMMPAERQRIHELIALSLNVDADQADLATAQMLLTHWLHARNGVRAAQFATQCVGHYKQMGITVAAIRVLGRALNLLDPGWNTKRRGAIASDFQLADVSGPPGSWATAAIRLLVLLAATLCDVHEKLQSAETYFYTLKKAEACEGDIDDFTCLFPVYSGLLLHLKWGIIADEGRQKELAYVDLFIQSTKKHGDPVCIPTHTSHTYV